MFHTFMSPGKPPVTVNFALVRRFSPNGARSDETVIIFGDDDKIVVHASYNAVKDALEKAERRLHA